MREALEGRCSLDGRTGKEQEVYVEHVLEAASGETVEQEAFFAARRKAGLGAVISRHDKLIKQAPDTPV